LAYFVVVDMTMILLNLIVSLPHVHCKNNKGNSNENRPLHGCVNQFV